MTGAWQPTALQERLLEACLLPGEPGARALLSWQAAADLQTLDASSYRLLPLLAARVDAPGIAPEFRALIKGVYRRTWYHNQLLLAEGRGLARRLAELGIPAMVLKGAALTLRHYRDAGARPMNDFDLAVPTEHAGRAVALLLEAGWVPGPECTGWLLSRRPRPLASFSRSYFGIRHAHGFKRADGIGLDLHWHVFQRQCDPDADVPSWEAAVRTGDDPAALTTLCDHEHLLLLLAHGSHYNRIPPIRWVADAVTLLRTSPAFDWDGLVAVAIRRRLTLPAAELLAYLDGRFDVRVPDGVLPRLRRHPVPRSVRRAYRRAVAPPSRLVRYTELGYVYGRYRALRAAPSPACPPGFLAFLCRVWDADGPLQILRCLGPRWLGRLRGALTGRGGPAPRGAPDGEPLATGTRGGTPAPAAPSGPTGPPPG